MLAEVKALSDSDLEMGTAGLDILDRARTGDHDAFHAIFQRYSKPVLSFVYNLLGDREYAEELMQETFIRAYRGLDRMREEAQLSTWLFGIARNVVREAIRKKYKDRKKVALDQLEFRGIHDRRPRPDEGLMAGELQDRIRRALTSLPEDHRVVFVLKIMHRMRYEEIARVTGSSIGKLKTDLHRARLEMRRKLEPYLQGSAAGMRGGI